MTRNSKDDKLMWESRRWVVPYLLGKRLVKRGVYVLHLHALEGARSLGMEIRTISNLAASALVSVFSISLSYTIRTRSTPCCCIA